MAKPRNAAESKAAKAQANAARKAAARQRRAQLWQAFTLQRKEDKRLLPYMIGAFLLIVGASVGVGVWAGGFTMFTMIPLGVLLGALVAFVIFGRRAQRTVYRKAEGQTGAAAWALDNLLAQEKKRTARLVGDVPIYDIIVGNGDGEVPLAKLERHLTRLPANITVKQMDTVESRLAALGSRAGAGVMPKGPLPTTAKMRSVQRTVRRK